MENNKMKVDSDEMKTKAGSDQSAEARKKTKKSKQGVNKGEKSKVKTPVAGADNSKQSRDATDKNTGLNTNKGSNTDVDIPIAGKDYYNEIEADHVSTQAGAQDKEQIDKLVNRKNGKEGKKKKTEEELKEAAKHAKKAKKMYDDMKRKGMSEDDMVDVLMSLSKSKKSEDEQIAMELAELIGSTNEELRESLVKHVSSKGKITRRKSRKVRRRQATQTTGLSKGKRRQIARKAARTKKANPGITKRAQRKRKRAMKKRKSLGL